MTDNYGLSYTLQNTHVRKGTDVDVHATVKIAFNGNIGSATGKGEGGGKEKGQEEELLVELLIYHNYKISSKVPFCFNFE